MRTPRRVTLDRGGEALVPEGDMLIESERGLLEAPCQGEAWWVRHPRPCEWAERLCRAWGIRPEIHRSRWDAVLEAFGQAALGLGDAERAIAEVYVETCAEGATPAGLLHRVTGEPLWEETPSPTHLARWLNTVLEPRLEALALPVMGRWAEGPEPFRKGYLVACSERNAWLAEWIDPRSARAKDLGPYTLPLTPAQTTAMKQRWLEALRHNGPGGLPDPGTIGTWSGDLRSSLAMALDEFLRIHPESVTSVAQILRIIGLERLIPPETPVPLSPEVTLDEALRWATDAYLPWRRWGLDHREPTDHAHKLAKGFGAWLLGQYPRLRQRQCLESGLNRKVAEIVGQTDGSVLWVIVDGLGYLEHAELLQMLAERIPEFEPSAALEPTIAVLPTLTTYAKWSVVTGRFPHEKPRDDEGIAEGFKRAWPDGEYFTDATFELLHQRIKEGAEGLYCWDTTELDHALHQERSAASWAATLKLQLQKTAEKIALLVEAWPPALKGDLTLVICSDHGQIREDLERADWFQDLEGAHLDGHQGRAFVGSLEADPQGRLAVLDPDAFGLGRPVSVLQTPEYLVGLALQGRASGTHGGLFPEEAVVGVSQLAVPQHLVFVDPKVDGLKGTGEVGRPGFLTVWVDNPNPVALTRFDLSAPGLQASSASGEMVPPMTRTAVQLIVAEWPAPDRGTTERRVDARLVCRTERGKRLEASVGGKLTCESLSTNTGANLLDEF